MLAERERQQARFSPVMGGQSALLCTPIRSSAMAVTAVERAMPRAYRCAEPVSVP